MKSGRQMLEEKAVSLGRLTPEQARIASDAYLIDHIKAVQLEQYREEREAAQRGKRK